MANITEDDEQCPVCRPTGPPSTSTSVTTSHSHPHQENGHGQAEAGAGAPQGGEINWIACTKCQVWFHSVCVARKMDNTLPVVLKEEMDSEGGEWWDWTKRVNRWYCSRCQALPSTSHPLTTTLKPQVSKTDRTRRRSSGGVGTPADAATAPPRSPKPKKARMDSLSPPPPLSRPSTYHPPPPPPRSTDSPLSDPPAPTPPTLTEQTTSRPKRQAALNRPDYHAMHNHIATPTARWLELIKEPGKYGTSISPDNFPRLPGSLLTKSWIESDDQEQYSPTLFYGDKREPLVVSKQDGGIESMGGKLPAKDLTVADVARLVGPQRTVEVIDTASQNSSTWTLEKWAEYIKTRRVDGEPTHKIYNIISLEISGTELAKRVRPPRLVRDIDWVDNFWNFGEGGKAQAVQDEEAERVKQENESDESAPKSRAAWPKVQLYCLMGAKGSWTDWHVDFAASSVYYSVHTGAKTFFFIRPTEANLKAYATWSGSADMQQNTWLGDMCDEVRQVTLTQGDTMIIPTGYIHAVYTPMDSIVFGGNFLHSYDTETQLRLRQIEIDTKVPQKFRFPQFDKLCWYVADRYCAELRAMRSFRPRAQTVPQPLHRRILQGLSALADFLVDQASTLEDSTAEDKKRRTIYDRIPAEVVSDPIGLAKELQWRVRRELPTPPAAAVEEELALKGKKRGSKRKFASGVSPSPAPASTPGPATESPFPPSEGGGWTEAPETVNSRSARVMQVRPDGAPDQVEEAVRMIEMRRKSRTRMRRLSDGSTVAEEQSVTITTGSTTWPNPLVKPDPAAPPAQAQEEFSNQLGYMRPPHIPDQNLLGTPTANRPSDLTWQMFSEARGQPAASWRPMPAPVQASANGGANGHGHAHGHMRSVSQESFVPLTMPVPLPRRHSQAGSSPPGASMAPPVQSPGAPVPGGPANHGQGQGQDQVPGTGTGTSGAGPGAGERFDVRAFQRAPMRWAGTTTSGTGSSPGTGYSLSVGDVMMSGGL